MRAHLLPLSGGPSIDIVKDMTVVGRKEDCDLRIDHKSISKIHCVIVKTDGLLLLRDLGSTNGTRVNGQRVRRAALLPNDQLAFANFHFRVAFGPDEPRPAAAQPVQQIDARQAAVMLGKDAGAQDEESSVDMPAQPVQLNPLPDLYPEDSPARQAR